LLVADQLNQSQKVLLEALENTVGVLGSGVVLFETVDALWQ
jgi:hypothetical protein